MASVTPDLRGYLPSQLILLGDRGTYVWTTCPGLHLTERRPGFEPTTSWLQIRHANHSATCPHVPSRLLYVGHCSFADPEKMIGWLDLLDGYIRDGLCLFLSSAQCYFSYVFSVSVSVIVVIYQLQFQLQLCDFLFFSFSYSCEFSVTVTVIIIQFLFQLVILHKICISAWK